MRSPRSSRMMKGAIAYTIERLESRTYLATTQVADLNFGAGNSTPSFTTNFSDVLFFNAVGTSGARLWRTDGTASGTTQVSTILPTIQPIEVVLDYGPGNTKVKNVLFFAASALGGGEELFMIDGTSGTPVRVADIVAGPAGSLPRDLIGAGGELYFTAGTAAEGRELWRTETLADGTVTVMMVEDINPGAADSNPSFLTAVGSTLFFAAVEPTHGSELWKSDGTPGGTQIVKDIFTPLGNSNPEQLVDAGGTLFFTAVNFGENRELWKSNGTDAGTTMVRAIVPGLGDGFLANLTSVRGRLFFTADLVASGRELWTSDGTFDGTSMVRDIFPGDVDGVGNSSNPDFFAACDTLYFAATDNGDPNANPPRPALGRELWKVVPGTPLDAALVEDINPGAANSDPQWLRFANGMLYFQARGATTGRELYKRADPGGLVPGDPAAEGIPMTVADINNGALFGAPIPPDPTAAVGPDHVVTVVNTSIQWHEKDGDIQDSRFLNNFFNAAVPAPDATRQLFDPKVVYDHYSCTFIVMALDQSNAGQISQIYIAQSDDSDPNGAWNFMTIDSKVVVGPNAFWADFPGLAVSRDSIYITANLQPFVAGTEGPRAYAIDKRVSLSNATPFTRIEPLVPASVTLQPALMFGATRDASSTFLVGFEPNGSGANEVMHIVRLENTNLDPTSPVVIDNQTIGLGDFAAAVLADAPQAGSTTAIETEDPGMLNAVWRNNHLWATNTISPIGAAGTPDVGEATVRWYDFDATNLAALTLANTGNVGGEDLGVGTHTFYPQIMVDSSNNMGIGFSASSPTRFGGAYYTGRRATDPAGETRAARILHPGEDFYVRIGGTRNRWGDYSGIALDPASTRAFWAFNEYARAREDPPSNLGRWGTAFAPFSLAAVPAQAGAIRGRVFNDANADGERNVGEQLLVAWTVYIDSDNDDTFDLGEPVSFTNAMGEYQFLGLARGDYTVREVVMPGWRQTSPSNGLVPPVMEFRVHVVDGQDFAVDREFGNKELPRVLQRAIQIEILPMSLTFAFNSNVSGSLTLADIVVQNLTTTTFHNPTGVSYDTNTNTATFTFSGILPDGDYRATLPAAGITDPQGDPLAQDDVFDFFILAADADRDRDVDLDDFNILATNFNTSGKTFSQGNFSYDLVGNVDLDDFNILATRFGQIVAPATSIFAAKSAGNDRIADQIGLFGESELA